MSGRRPITAQGRARIMQRLENLRNELPVVISAIAEAKARGDLSENFEYHAAKRHKGDLEKEIGELEEYIRSVVPSKLPANPTFVCFGSRVTLESDSGSASYVIVGDRESDVHRGSLSISSPLFQAMIGKQVGTVTVFNNKHYKITDIAPVSEAEIESVLFNFS